jgi:histone-binding protein RBBP4
LLQVRQEDVLALDWSHDGVYIATGDNKGWMDVYDLRRVSDNAVRSVFSFSQASPRPKAVIAVTWNPLQPSWVACGGEDGRVSVYDTGRPDKPTADTLPAQLVLQHIGHLGSIMDAQWSPHDPFLMMSVSNDGRTYKEGGACQLWRLSWLLHCDLEQAESKLKRYQKWLESGELEDLPEVVCVDGGERTPPAAHKPPKVIAETTTRGTASKAEPGVGEVDAQGTGRAPALEELETAVPAEVAGEGAEAMEAKASAEPLGAANLVPAEVQQTVEVVMGGAEEAEEA